MREVKKSCKNVAEVHGSQSVVGVGKAIVRAKLYAYRQQFRQPVGNSTSVESAGVFKMQAPSASCMQSPHRPISTAVAKQSEDEQQCSNLSKPILMHHGVFECMYDCLVQN
jgi:hypothetical protein